MTNNSTFSKLRQDQPGTLHVGVDLALDKNMVAVISERAEKLDRFSFPQNREGYEYFFRRVESLQQKHHASKFVLAMEPTNYFWKLLARGAEERQIAYHLVNAYTVKKHREGNQLDVSKDDPRDADQIAELSRTGHYTETRLQQGNYEELRQYSTLHEQLAQAIRREEQVLSALAGQAFPEMSQVFKDLEGRTSRAILVSCGCAAAICQRSEEQFLDEVQIAYTGKRLLVSRVRRAYQLAATSIGLSDGLQALQMGLRLHFSQLEALKTQLEQVEQAMAACLVALPEAPYLLSMTSMKATTVALFLAEVGDPKRYRMAAQWVKLAGIQPVPNTSGRKQRSRTPMSRHGRARLRTLLYFACLRLVQQDSHFAQLYADLQRRSKNPLTRMQAIGVLMNKLLHILWALAKNQTFYNPSFAQSI
jgi:transposase